tara:strand:- start:164 stop:316 length:153 start_codon:yes stop_codon:yes gene_type:complete
MGTRARVKFSHRGGVLGRRKRALDRLMRYEPQSKQQMKEIDILLERTKGK